MSKEKLLDVVKKQMLMKKHLDTRISELQASNVSLCQDAEVI